jgi:hypothetical protein
VDHPNRSGHHDDLSNVCAGVLWRLQAGVAPLVVTAELLQRVAAMPPRRPSFGINRRSMPLQLMIPDSKKFVAAGYVPAERLNPSQTEGD